VHLLYIDPSLEGAAMSLLKSTNLNLRIAPEVRDALRQAAEREHRSISNMLEYLIVQHCQKNDIPITKHTGDTKPMGIAE
jgi:hypothetical protein